MFFLLFLSWTLIEISSSEDNRNRCTEDNNISYYRNHQNLHNLLQDSIKVNPYENAVKTSNNKKFSDKKLNKFDNSMVFKQHYKHDEQPVINRASLFNKSIFKSDMNHISDEEDGASRVSSESWLFVPMEKMKNQILFHLQLPSAQNYSFNNLTHVNVSAESRNKSFETRAFTLNYIQHKFKIASFLHKELTMDNKNITNTNNNKEKSTKTLLKENILVTGGVKSIILSAGSKPLTKLSTSIPKHPSVNLNDHKNISKSSSFNKNKSTSRLPKRKSSIITVVEKINPALSKIKQKYSTLSTIHPDKNNLSEVNFQYSNISNAVFTQQYLVTIRNELQINGDCYEKQKSTLEFENIKKSTEQPKLTRCYPILSNEDTITVLPEISKEHSGNIQTEIYNITSFSSLETHVTEKTTLSSMNSNSCKTTKVCTCTCPEIASSETVSQFEISSPIPDLPTITALSTMVTLNESSTNEEGTICTVETEETISTEPEVTSCMTEVEETSIVTESILSSDTEMTTCEEETSSNTEETTCFTDVEETLTTSRDNKISSNEEITTLTELASLNTEETSCTTEIETTSSPSNIEDTTCVSEKEEITTRTEATTSSMEVQTSSTEASFSIPEDTTFVTEMETTSTNKEETECVTELTTMEETTCSDEVTHTIKEESSHAIETENASSDKTTCITETEKISSETEETTCVTETEKVSSDETTSITETEKISSETEEITCITETEKMSSETEETTCITETEKVSSDETTITETEKMSSETEETTCITETERVSSDETTPITETEKIISETEETTCITETEKVSSDETTLITETEKMSSETEVATCITETEKVSSDETTLITETEKMSSETEVATCITETEKVSSDETTPITETEKIISETEETTCSTEAEKISSETEETSCTTEIKETTNVEETTCIAEVDTITTNSITPLTVCLNVSSLPNLFVEFLNEFSTKYGNISTLSDKSTFEKLKNYHLNTTTVNESRKNINRSPQYVKTKISLMSSNNPMSRKFDNGARMSSVVKLVTRTPKIWPKEKLNGVTNENNDFKTTENPSMFYYFGSNTKNAKHNFFKKLTKTMITEKYELDWLSDLIKGLTLMHNDTQVITSVKSVEDDHGNLIVESQGQTQKCIRQK